MTLINKIVVCLLYEIIWNVWRLILLHTFMESIEISNLKMQIISECIINPH